MNFSNGSVCSVSEFDLVCFPELNMSHYFLTIPLVVLMLSSLVANLALKIAVYAEPALQEPMFYCLSMLASVDVLLCIVSTPKTLAILWFDRSTIELATCFTQMYFIHCCVDMESALFLLLAFDRYVAICHPLRYPTIITTALVQKAAFFMLMRSLLLSLPLPLLAAYQNYCSDNDIFHCFCETRAVVSLSSTDDTSIRIYRLCVTSIVQGTDVLFISFSYCMIIRAVLRLGNLGATLKAFRTCSSHLILILFFYSTIITILVSNQTHLGLPRHNHVLLSILHHLVPPALNPIVYGIRTKEIRQVLRKLVAKIASSPMRWDRQPFPVHIH